jgi:aryl-alcohol dehydrogenase-like predicted oxidoreductase
MGSLVLEVRDLTRDVTCVILATADLEHLEQNMAAGAEPLADEKMRREIADAWDTVAGAPDR